MDDAIKTGIRFFTNVYCDGFASVTPIELKNIEKPLITAVESTSNKCFWDIQYSLSYLV